jgi:phosphatidylinositol 4-kinase A
MLAVRGAASDLRPFLRILARICSDCLRYGNAALLGAVMNARVIMAKNIPKSSPLYEIYLTHLFDTIVSTTGAIQSDKKPVKDGVLGAEEIGQILRPLAVLISKEPEETSSFEDLQLLSNLSRDAWYNLVAHDFTLNSSLTRRHMTELEILALHTPSLIDKNGADVRESGVELNTVLRRNMNPAHTAQQRQALITSFPKFESDIKSFDYAELTFLNAAHLIAVLRAKAGQCTRTLEYFFDNKFKSGRLSDVLIEIAKTEVETYLIHTKAGKVQKYGAPELAQQLVVLFQGCCNRIFKVQQVATLLAERIITQVPSSLCQKPAMFAMLELLTLIWNSCLDEEAEDVEWQAVYTSKKGNVSIQLSDDFDLRRLTLTNFLRNCRRWVPYMIEIMPLDTRGLLQTYLSDFEDVGAYGHVALGRSFALEMGCLIPANDLRIGTMDRRLDIGINSASDFIAQYTTRQEYRTIDSIFDANSEVTIGSTHLSDISHEDLAREVKDVLAVLQAISTRVDAGEDVHIDELRPALRRAAALLCRSDVTSTALVTLLVRIPCTIYSREVVKLAVSLWMGVVRENERLETQFLVEVAMQWEDNVRKGRTIYDSSMQ